MFGINFWPYVAALFLAVSGFAGYEKIEHDRWEAKYGQIVADTRAAGLKAMMQEKAHTAQDVQDKETADAKYKTDTDTLKLQLAALPRKLRLTDPGKRTVCGTAPGAKCPARITFDGAKLDAAVREFQAETGSELQLFSDEVSGLVGEGQATQLKLDTAIHWAAKERKK